MNGSVTPTRSASTCALPLPLLLFLALPFFLVACQIVEVEQPSEAVQGEIIEVTVSIANYQEDTNAHHGILSVLVPDDWTFVSGTYSGDMGSGAMEESKAWADSTTIVVPPPDGMMWIGTITDQPRAVPANPSYADATLRLQVGQRTGDFRLSYFITSSAFDTDDMDFTESGEYDDNTADMVEDQLITVRQSSSTEDGVRPGGFSLAPNFPNPFTASTHVGYSLDRAASVRVTVYDLAGRQVAVVDEGLRSTGPHTVEFDGTDLPVGTYLYRLEVEGETVYTRRMTRVR
jgi:hypothetical protein